MTATPQVQTVYDGRLFKVELLTVEDGQGRPMRREVVRHPGAVLIVPVLDGGRVVMIRNARIAVREQLWEFPAGKLESNEAPERAAQRELLEETGYRASKWRKAGEFFTSPGFTDELMRVFVAEKLTFVGQQLEDGEDIHVETVSRDQAMAMARDGRIRDGKTIAGLLLWQAVWEGMTAEVGGA